LKDSTMLKRLSIVFCTIATFLLIGISSNVNSQQTTGFGDALTPTPITDAPIGLPGFSTFQADTPNLISPENASSVVDYPTFTWTEVPGVKWYRLVVEHDGKKRIHLKFTGAEKIASICIARVCTVNTAALTNIKDLNPDKTYTWYVIVKHTDGRKLESQQYTLNSASLPEFTLPELTPTPARELQSNTMQSLSRILPGTAIGISYAVIAATDFDGLKQAIAYSNSKPSLNYPIYLHAGTYNFTETLVVQGRPQIYGRGMDVTILKQVIVSGNSPGAMNGLFTLPGSYLKLDNVTLLDGSMTYSVVPAGAGGGVWIQGANSVLEVRSSKFNSNDASRYGGAIYVAQGRAAISHTYFINNVAGTTSDHHGGAIYNFSNYVDPSGNTHAVNLYCTTFDGNSSTGTGGAITNVANQGRIRISASDIKRSNLIGGGTGVLRHAYSFVISTATILASGNYWATPSVTASTNTFGIDTSSLRTTEVPDNLCPLSAFPPQTIPPLPATLTPTPPPTATATPTPPPVSYGIRLSTGWTSSEQTAIQTAVQNVAEAFRIQLGISSSVEAFNRVMVNGNDPQYVYFFKANAPSESVTIVYPPELNKPNHTVTVDFPGCLAVNSNELPRTIVCNWGTSAGQTALYPEHAIVHELGHTFSNRSQLLTSPNPQEQRGLLFAAVQGTYSGACSPNFLPPTHPDVADPNAPDPFDNMEFTDSTCDGIADLTGGNVMGIDTGGTWQRGKRGWGSGPDNIFTPFQQHPPGKFTGESSDTRVDETAADMFLNWVYRRRTNNPPSYQVTEPGTWDGFKNLSWVGNVTTGVTDGKFTGDARFEWMNRVMNRIFSVKGW
jgi:hypothetical protein